MYAPCNDSAWMTLIPLAPVSWSTRAAAAARFIQSSWASEVRLSNASTAKRCVVEGARRVQETVRHNRRVRRQLRIPLQNTRLHRQQLLELRQFFQTGEFRLFLELLLFLKPFFQSLPDIQQSAVI